MQIEDTHYGNAPLHYASSVAYHPHHSRRTRVAPFDYGDTVAQPSFEEPAYTDALVGDEMTETMQELVMEVQYLRQELEKKAHQDEAYEYLTKSLHKELQTYRESLHFKLLRPIFLDMISMYHDLGSLINVMRVQDRGTLIQRSIKNMASFQETIEEILCRYGVEPYRVEGNTFHAGQQRISQVIHTPDSNLDKQIALRVHKGFKYEDKILSPEIVTVYKAEQEK